MGVYTNRDYAVKNCTNCYAFGMAMNGRGFNLDKYPFGLNGQMKTPEIQDNHYTALYWEYDARIGRRWNLDPKPQISISDYAVFGNNPIRNNDVLGDTKEEREKAVKKSKEYKEKNPGKSYKWGGKGKPGEGVDCSGMVSNCIESAGVETGAGVKGITKASRKISINDIQEGSLVTFKSNGSEEGHIGIISNVERDEDGNVVSYKMIHSSSSNGPVESKKIDPNAKKTWAQGYDEYWAPKVANFYAWDTPEASDNRSTPVIAKMGSTNISKQVGSKVLFHGQVINVPESPVIKQTEYKFSDYLKESKAPIVRDFGSLIGKLGL